MLHQKKASITHAAHLVFDVRTGLLSGTINPKDRAFHLHADSGGGRGHLKVTPHQAKAFLHGQSTSLMSHLETTQEVKDPHGRYVQRGGPIPDGTYICHYEKRHPGFLNPVVRLEPTASALVINSPFASMPISPSRSGLLIHLRGPKGSDGCIVLERSPEQQRLFSAIRDYRVVLKVINNIGYVLPAENFAGRNFVA